MQKLAHQQSGNLGEVLALAKINSLELAAYSSPDGAPGHDLMVVLEGRTVSIEVKTRQFLAPPPIQRRQTRQPRDGQPHHCGGHTVAALSEYLHAQAALELSWHQGQRH